MLIGIPLLTLAMPILLNFTYEDHQSYWLHQVPESMIYVTGFWMAFRFLIIYLHKKYPEYSQATERVKIEILAILIAAPLLKFILEGISHIILFYCSIEDHQMPGHLEILLNIYIPSGLIASLYEAFYYFKKYKESVIEKEKLEKVHVQSQLDNLRNQINPHFLFNSLNTLMNLIPTDPDSAMDYLSKLSKFYRYTVNAKEEMKSPLAKELDSAKLYADLLKVRFRDGISFDFPEVHIIDHYLLPMSLQLLIENAVKHNIVSKSKPLNVTIAIDESKEYVTVTNNLQKKIEVVSSTGMGLKNIHDRYSYFTDREMKCEKTDDSFVVSLPLLKI
jgi:sensor histidine kinase YesM